MYGKVNTLVGQAHERLQLEDYMLESLRTFEHESIWGKLLYKEDIPAVDPLTGAAYKKTIRFAKPQGPGGVGSFAKDTFQNAKQPGNIGMMIPTGEQITIGTQFKYTTIGRTYQDKLVDQTGLYDAIKEASMGSQITAALEEMTKSAIYNAAEKTAAKNLEGKDLASVASADGKLTWADIVALVESKETYLVQMRNNHARANTDFANAVKAVTDLDTDGAPAVYGLNDFNAWADAQAAFAANWRTERWATPRYIITGTEAVKHYSSEFVKMDEINISLPAYRTLYSKEMKNQISPMLVIVGNAGYRQLFEDEDFRAAVEVSGYKHETGHAGRVPTFIAHEQAINVQGILIMNVQQNELKYTEADLRGDSSAASVLQGGVSYGDSVNGAGTSFSTAFTAVPGFNFITTATEGIGTNGVRVTTKTFSDVDLIDRFGFQEFTNMLFAWDTVILDPTAFSLVYHAE